ncbi:LysR family transcriptional regulator [Pinirhizobacter sp.]|jgi:DNA-binding transcriptional LysR family regulator|uniref:LysR family transcriptional regulator n=1 Tax=Pinirhizobacter sp. TaxID=2950432 RepID=UPI002F3EBE57
MNTHDLAAFIAVVDAGSIVQAANKLHLTQPAVTRRVQGLESLLGVELLDRQSKPLRPSAAGREVYRKGRQLLEAESELMTSVNPGTEPGGELRLGMPPYLADMMLATPIDRLRERFPKLSLRIQSTWSPGLTAAVEGDLLDAAVIGAADGNAPPASLIAHAFSRQPIRIVAAPSLGLPAKIDLKRLAGFSWVLSQNGCGMRTVLRRTMEAANLPFNVTVEAVGSELQLSLVARGAGVGMVTADLLERSHYRDRLKVLTVADFRTDVVGWLAYRPLPPRLAAPVALLLEELRKLPIASRHTRSRKAVA